MVTWSNTHSCFSLLTSEFTAEPDLSNPTRSRWERPLDTIRSFDRAIDSEFKRKQAINKQGAFFLTDRAAMWTRTYNRGADPYQDGGNGYASRRSSYYGGGMFFFPFFPFSHTVTSFLCLSFLSLQLFTRIFSGWILLAYYIMTPVSSLDLASTCRPRVFLPLVARLA